MAVTIPTLYDLPAAYGSEAKEFQRLLFLGDTRTSSGRATFQSTTGSLTFYDTDVGTGVPSEDSHIVGLAENGLFYWLGTLILNSYNIAKTSWDAIINDMGNVINGAVSSIDLSSGDYTLATADYNKQVLIISTGHASNAIILPAVSSYKYNIINLDASHVVLAKKSGGTAVTIPVSSKAIVSYDGTNYVFISKPVPDGDVVGTTDTQTLINKTITSPLLQGDMDGWIYANETWTYASANTFTIGEDVTSKYQIGDKIKFTQTTVKYFYITALSYSSPNTTIAVVGIYGDVVANATISLNYYSKIESPRGFYSVQFLNGWRYVDESWAYASATTITVPSGAANRFQKGDKLKLNNTGTKYFYIIGVADTVLTVTGGASYSVDNSAISSIYISKMDNPIGFPNYGFPLGTPTWTTSGTAFTNQPINNSWYLNISDGMATIYGQAQCHATSGGTGTFTATFATGYLPTVQLSAVGIANNMTGTIGGFSWINANNIIRCAKYDGTTLATNNQYFGGNCSYKF